MTKKGPSKETVKKKKCSSTGCSFNNKTNIDELKEKIVTKIYDVEELVNEGQQMSACPYYATRAAIPFSQLVVIPYNTLLHKSTREASRIKLDGNIVIIDEAHNLLDAIGNMHSSNITGNQVSDKNQTYLTPEKINNFFFFPPQLCLCHNQLTNYRDKYEKLFSARNLLHLNQLIHVVGQLTCMLGKIFSPYRFHPLNFMIISLTFTGGKGGCHPIESSRKGTDTKIFTLSEFVHVAEIDNYNLYKLTDFCRKSKITHKVFS